MTDETVPSVGPAWADVDGYLEEALGLGDEALAAALAATAAAGLPDISITASQGRFLQVLARTVRARAILEIGTLGAYSTIWLGRALAPGGRLVSLEIDPERASIARRNLDAAGLGAACEVRVGAALDLLPSLEGCPPSPFDLIFIDADKPAIPEYFEAALRLGRPGSLIIVDNVVRKGEVCRPDSTDPRVIGVRHLIDRLRDDARVQASVIQTVGRKGHDGFVLALIRDPT